MATLEHVPGAPPPEASTLKPGALGLVDSVTMAVAGTAPAYSLTATTAVLVAAVGLGGPAALLYAAVPMFGITFAFLYLNRWRSDSGASYTWIGRALNPSLGFLAGWALMVSNALFMVSGSLPLGATTLHLLAPRLENNVLAATLVGTLWFLAVAVPVFFGITPTAKVQKLMTGIEVGGLLLLAVGALIKFSLHPVVPFSWSWFSPHQFPSVSAFMAGMLVAVFYYCGWDVSSNLAEETREPNAHPGSSGVYSMVGLVVLFVAVQTAIQMGLTSDQVQNNAATILPLLGDMILPKPLGSIAIIAVIFSSLATLETGLLQSSRSLYAMGRDRVLGARFADLHPKYRTPWLASLVTGLITLVLFALASLSPSINTLMSSLISAIGLQIVFYYSLAGIACFWYYRKTLSASPKALLMQGLWPLLSALFLIVVGAYNIKTLDRQTTLLSLGTIAVGVLPLLYFRIKNKSAFYTTPTEHAVLRGGVVILATSPEKDPLGAD